MEYNVRIEFDTQPTEQNIGAVLTHFDFLFPAVSKSEFGRLEVWITTHAADVGGAVILAVNYARQLGWQVLALEALLTVDFDERLNRTPMPALVNAEQAAEILNISKAAVGQKFASGELPGQRVGERSIVFARSDIEHVADRRKGRRFELYTDKSGEFRFRLKASNGEVIALSSEGYSSKEGALNGIETIRRNAADAAVVDIA